jgi:hypothetical protein
MKTHFEKEPHFNGSLFRNLFWKRKHVFGKVKSNQSFFLNTANSIRKGSRMFGGTTFDGLIISNPEFSPSES